MTRLALACLLVIAACLPAAAARGYPVQEFAGDRYAGRLAQGASAGDVTRSIRASRSRHRHYRRHRAPRPGWVAPLTLAKGMIHEAGQALGGRPRGCPYRFCGCALSLKLFGRIIPHLNLAANWRAFPRAAPQPGMVAARHGHVFQLLAHRGASLWQVWDANSGRGRIRVHDRSIAGYVIVDPRGRS